jgi:hypothetical protein
MIACRAALPHLKTVEGNIVNTVSNLALAGAPHSGRLQLVQSCHHPDDAQHGCEPWHPRGCALQCGGPRHDE